MAIGYKIGSLIKLIEGIEDKFHAVGNPSLRIDYFVPAVTCINQKPAIIEFILSHSSFFKQHPIILGAIAGKTIGLRL